MRRRAVRGGAAVVLLLLVVGTMSAAPAASSSGSHTVRTQDNPIVTGGGSSFAGLEMQQWRASVSGPPYELRINYNSAGSTFGREQYLAGTLDFGASDIPFQRDEIDRLQSSGRGDFVYVPVSAGALAFMFNVVGSDGQRITDLRLTQPDVCRIFTEPDMKWNDPSIAATNPGLPLPDRVIRPVLRSDGSGTSYVLSEYCIATAPDIWGRFIGYIGANHYNQGNADFYDGLPTSNWPSGWGATATAPASDGVANTVANDVSGRDSITYVETGQAKVKGAPAALVRNGAGEFAPPEPANATVALGYAAGRVDGTFRLEYLGADPRAYFPSTYSYVIAQTGGFDPAKGRVLATFLNYVVTAGQQAAEPLKYSRLSEVLVNLALDKITQIPGAPPRPTDLFGAPPPPDVLGVGVIGLGAAAGGVSGGAGGSGAAGGAAGGAGAAGGSGASGSAGAGGVGTTDPAAAGTGGGSAEDGYQLALPEGGAEELAEGAERTSSTSTRTGPGNREALFTLLQGALLVAVGTFIARGVRSSWQRT